MRPHLERLPKINVYPTPKSGDAVPQREHISLPAISQLSPLFIRCNSMERIRCTPVIGLVSLIIVGCFENPAVNGNGWRKILVSSPFGILCIPALSHSPSKSICRQIFQRSNSTTEMWLSNSVVGKGISNLHRNTF